ncbi:MAG: efflux RND transporter permease subunit [Clostridium sp.]|nr:efflux RND transporter permease subunit [Clostridium sp.]
MAMSISIIILLVGAISGFNLPIEQYPDIAPPTVQVSATYTGASAEAVTKAVIQPLEEAINGVEDMIYMSSTATNSGSATINVFFKQGTNADMAAVNVQNRVARAQGLLPSEVTRIGVTTQKRQTSFLQINALVSEDPTKYDEDFLSNYLDINIVPQMKRVEGVGDVMVMGGTYSLRIWLKPDVMAQYHLMPDDITGVIGEQNLESPTGSLGERPVNGNHGKGYDNVFQYTMKYTGRLQEIEEFRNIVIMAKADGSLLRLKDVAEIELGAISYAFHGATNGKPGITFMTYQLAGSNAKETNDRVSAKLKELSNDLPEGVHFVNMMSSNDFLLASIHNVWETLFIAILLVILVVYFFLQDLKATIIPSISIIVSMVGTFAILQMAGFTINLLTLFALVLAIGTVVDDAIVVVEAVQAKFDAGYTSSYQATKDAMSDVTMAVISCTFVFMAVFIPVTFMGGTSGVFYTQFGITMAGAVGLSCVSALVLCPALCAMMMRPSDGTKSAKSFNGRVRAAYNATYTAISNKYVKGMRFLFGHRLYSWIGFAVACVLLVLAAGSLKTGLVPQEDQGVLMLNVSCSPGSNLATTNEILNQVEDSIKTIDEVQDFSRVAGYGFMSGQGTSYGLFIVRLKPWEERLKGLGGFAHQADIVYGKLYMMLSKIPGAQIMIFQPPMISGYGMGGMVELHLQDKSGGDKATFFEQAKVFQAKLNERPEVMMAMTTYSRDFPQLQVEVDAAQCKRAGISPATVLSTLGAYCGGSYISNMNQFGKVYRVMLQAEETARLDEHALNNMFVRNGSEMAPLSQFIKLTPVLGPEVDNRFNLFSALDFSVVAAAGYSTTDVMKVIEEVSAETLPSHIGYEYGSISREEAQTIGNHSTELIYLICVVLIFLILSCLYESFLVPWAVILSVPAGLMGSFGFAWLWNQLGGISMGPLKLSYVIGTIENNIYLQTGVIMLIGLLAKTAILITEFALERRRKGMGIVESAYAACEARLRPILMTVLTLIFGMIPLMFASGAGANGNRTIAVGVVGGAFVGTIAILFTVPVFFVFFEYLQERLRPAMKVEADRQFKLEQEKSQAAREALNADKDNK